MATAVVFGFDGVVFQTHPRQRLHRLAQSSPLAQLDIEGALWGSGLVEAAERGLYDAQQFAGEARQRARLALDYVDLREAWVSDFKPVPAVLELIGRLRPGLTLAAFANGSELLQFGLERRWPEVMSRFGRIIWSHEARARKPSGEAFQFAVRLLGCPAAELCYVDVGGASVAAGREAGWDVIEFTAPEALERELRGRGLLAP